MKYYVLGNYSVDHIMYSPESVEIRIKNMCAQVESIWSGAA